MMRRSPHGSGVNHRKFFGRWGALDEAHIAYLSYSQFTRRPLNGQMHELSPEARVTTSRWDPVTGCCMQRRVLHEEMFFRPLLLQCRNDHRFYPPRLRSRTCRRFARLSASYAVPNLNGLPVVRLFIAMLSSAQYLDVC